MGRRIWRSGLGILLGFPLMLPAQALVLQDTFLFAPAPGYHRTGGSDVWGYTDSSGTQYCLMGLNMGVMVVDITHHRKVQLVPGPYDGDVYYHRDIETYGHYAYVASELWGRNQGIMILDLSPLPDSVRYVGSYVPSSGHVTAHNLFVDTATGYMYVVRTFTGIEIVSLQNPELPVQVNFLPDTPTNVHDVYARNDTLLVADELNGTFSIWDVQNKLNPILKARISVPETAWVPQPIVHTIWMWDQAPVIFVGDEDYGYTTPLKVYQLLPGDSVALVDTFYGGFAIPHNVYTLGNLLFMAAYQHGALVLDISNPAQPVELAHYDTYPWGDSARGGGAWGVYAFPDSTLCVSNMDQVLYVFKYDPTTHVKETLPGRRIQASHLQIAHPTSTISIPNMDHSYSRYTLLDLTGRVYRLFPVRRSSSRIVLQLTHRLSPGRYLLRMERADE